MTPRDEFREAVTRLHRAKDAAYRDAWKRRGEVISILANIARKVDRLEYGIDRTPAAPDESQFDTAADLLVYCLKYQAYLADQDPETAARLFSTQPVSVRLGRLLALTNAAIGLTGALQHEHAQEYARFTSACLAMGEGEETADAR